MSALAGWREQLAAWAIPEEILAAAPESPWGFPAESFRRRAEAAADAAPTPTTVRALESLSQGGSVLDVGVGGGATSMPLAGRARHIVGVDGWESMLESFRTSAGGAGIEAVGVLGSWPDVAAEVPPADVAVCGHVLYNVQDLEPFLRALTDHARQRVVVEVTATHPLAWMSDLWRRFHGLERPSGPTADDAEAAIRELGLDVAREDRSSASRSGGFERREDAIALVRRRLCLGQDRDEEIATALGERLAERGGRWSAGPREQTLATMWWPGSAAPG